MSRTVSTALAVLIIAAMGLGGVYLIVAQPDLNQPLPGHTWLAIPALVAIAVCIRKLS